MFSQFVCLAVMALSPVSDPKNPAVAPTVNLERDSYNWLWRHREILERQQKVGWISAEVNVPPFGY